MGKFKRNKGIRNGQSKVGAFLNGDVDAANAEVRAAEQQLLEARQRAAAAAQAQSGRDPGLSSAHRTARDRVRRAHLTVDLDDAGGRDPEDQANAFFNRPGDYFLARFAIKANGADEAGVAEVRAETVLKASEDQFDYLLEVLRQIRGGFGERCRIELFRTHTREPDLQTETIRSGGRVRPTSQQFVDEAVREDRASDIGAKPFPPNVTSPREPMPPWVRGLDDSQPPRDLTRQEIQQQLPGMTRTEAAAELGVQPEGIGGTFQATGDLQREELAAELGVPVESLQPIAMQGGGNAYAIAPEAREPQGRHAAPDLEPKSAGFKEKAARAWAGPGWYLVRPARADAFNWHCSDLSHLESALIGTDATEVYKLRQIADNPQA